VKLRIVELLLAALLGLLSPESATALLYSAEPIEGWVVDADTGKPIEGVIVVAHWQLRGGFEGGTPVAELQILETRTAQSGRYFFPGWGPKLALSGHFTSQSPEIIFFKPGYNYRAVMNQWYRGRPTGKSDHDKRTVQLGRFSGTLEQYADHLSALNTTLWIVGFEIGDYSGDYCGWKRFPALLQALKAVESQFRASGVRRHTAFSSFRSNEAELKKRGCVSFNETFEEAVK
jgi:hypothetical protein